MNTAISRFTSRNISVVIVTYNSASTITACLKSIKSYLSRYLVEVIVVDNNSTDDSIKTLKDLKDKGYINELFFRKENFGFAKSINFGVKKSRGKFLLIINPDIKINSSKNIEEYIKYSQSSNNLITGPMMYSRDGITERSFVRFPNWLIYIFDFTNLRKIFPNNPWHKGFYYMDDVFVAPTKVDSVSGAFMFFSRKIFNALNGFDTKYFMYLEDIDYCLRAKKLLKTKCIYFPGTDIKHLAGSSSKNKDRVNHVAWINSRNRYLHINEQNKFLVFFISILFIFDSTFIMYKIRKI